MLRKVALPLLLATLLLTVTASAAQAETLEVMLFQTGYGTDWILEAAKEYEAAHPGVKIDITISPEIWNQLRPRFIAGNPPDLFSPGWSLDVWSLYREGQLMRLNEALETPNYAGTAPWKEDFDPLLVAAHSYQGEIYGIPYFFGMGVWAWWYDKALFEKHGWELPKTWDDLYTLNEQVRKAGLYLFALQGINPNYYTYGIYLPLVQMYGGMEAINAAFNLEPGAWKSEPFLKAAQETKRMIDAGMFLPGTLGLTHTQAQTQFFLGRTAFCISGSWLEAEMQDIIPAGFQLRALPYPAVVGGKGDPTAVQGAPDWSSNFYIPAKAKNPERAIDFLKYLTQRRIAENLVAQSGVLTAIAGANEAVQSQALASVVELVENAGTIWNAGELDAYYPAFTQELWNLYQALFTGELTPEEFVERVEAEAEKVRNSGAELRYIHF